MNKFPFALLAVAADLRANGCSWEAIAQKVGRSPDTCRHWPLRFPAAWRPLFRAAEEQTIAATASKSLAILRTLLRDECEQVRIVAAQTILRGRLTRAAPAEAPPLSTEEYLEWAAPHIEQLLADGSREEPAETGSAPPGCRPPATS